MTTMAVALDINLFLAYYSSLIPNLIIACADIVSKVSNDRSTTTL